MNVVFLDVKTKTYLLSLEQSSSNKAFRLIKLLVTFGNMIGMPYSKKLLSNLYELRVRGQQEVRIFYFFYNDSRGDGAVNGVYYFSVFQYKSLGGASDSGLGACVSRVGYGFFIFRRIQALIENDFIQS